MDVTYLVFFQMWDFIEGIIVQVTWEKKNSLNLTKEHLYRIIVLAGENPEKLF